MMDNLVALHHDNEPRILNHHLVLNLYEDNDNDMLLHDLDNLVEATMTMTKQARPS
jgi:hypothetical protein